MQYRTFITAFVLMTIFLSPASLLSGGPDEEMRDVSKKPSRVHYTKYNDQDTAGNVAGWTQEKEDHLNQVLAWWGLLF